MRSSASSRATSTWCRRTSSPRWSRNSWRVPPRGADSAAEPALRVLDHHLVELLAGHPALLQLRDDALEQEGHRPVRHLVRLQVALDLDREPVDRRAIVLREEHAVGVSLLEQGEHGLLALLGGQEDVEPVAVHADPAARIEEALDVVEIVGVAGVGDLHLRRIDALLLEDPHLLRTGAAGRARVGHDRAASLDRGARRGAVDLLDVRSDAGLVGGALDEGGLDAGALNAVLDLMDEDGGHGVLVAVEEELRKVVVGVDARGEHDLKSALVGDALAESGVAVEEHGARLDDGLDAMPLDRVGVVHGGVPLALLVIEMRELEATRLVDGPEVLVDEREAELLDVDGPVDGLDIGHAGLLPGVRCGKLLTGAQGGPALAFFANLPHGGEAAPPASTG